MLKKFMCLFAVMVLVSACESTGSEAGMGGPGGLNGKGMTPAEVAATPGTPEGLVKIGDRVFFDFDEAKLSEDGHDTLSRQTIWLKKYKDLKIIIEGHCDERGTREYNLALGDRRAMAAKNYLVAEGISAKRIKTVSYGKERPAVLGHSEEDWEQNRRAVSIIAQ